jgi:hypothetical protein
LTQAASAAFHAQQAQAMFSLSNIIPTVGGEKKTHEGERDP